MPRAALVLLGAVGCLVLAACSGVEMKPGDKARNAREIREGPGILTGADGEFVIFRVDKTKADEDNGEWQDVADPETADPNAKEPEAVE